MREIVRAGMTLRKIQPGVCRLQWMGQQPPIESRGTRSFTAYTVERRVFAQDGSFSSMLQDLKSIAQKAEKQKTANHQTMSTRRSRPDLACPLCEAGLPLLGEDHISKLQSGTPAMRCRKEIQRGDIKRYREILNAKYPGQRHKHNRHHQIRRPYGDYLYAQDRDKFLRDMCEWLPTLPAP